MYANPSHLYLKYSLVNVDNSELPNAILQDIYNILSVKKISISMTFFTFTLKHLLLFCDETVIPNRYHERAVRNYAF